MAFVAKSRRFDDLWLRSISAISIFSLGSFCVFKGSIALFVLIVLFLALASFEVFKSGVKNRPLFWFLKFCAIAVSALGAFAFFDIRNDFGVGRCFWLITVVSLVDVGAYFSGRMFGGPIFCSLISPNKTWAGMVGAFVFGTLAGVYFARAFGIQASIVFIELLIFFTILGDLLESAFKRSIGVKDVGSVIPGHGGILDRFDSLFSASIFCWIYLNIQT